MTDDQKFVAELTTGLFGKPQVVRATLDLAGENFPVEAETTLTGADLTPLFAALLNNPNVQVTGRATGTIRASGTLLSEEASLTPTPSPAAPSSRSWPCRCRTCSSTAENPLVVTFKPNEVTFERTRFTGPGTNITFGGTAALGAGGRQNLTVNGDLNLRLLSSAQPQPLPLGRGARRRRRHGTFEQPQVTGTASVENASLALLSQNERLTATQINGHGALQLESGQHRIFDGPPRRRARLGDGRRAHLGLRADAVPPRRARRERDGAGRGLRHAARLPRRPADHGRRRPRNPRRLRGRLRQRHGQGAPHRDHRGHRPRRPDRPRATKSSRRAAAAAAGGAGSSAPTTSP
jgi:hypothetical protein